MVLATNSREIIRITGNDARDFLQGLVTNDVNKIDQGLVYTALLTPQGKFLFDFFLFADGPDVMLDVAADQFQPLLKRLGMYRLRADVDFNAAPFYVECGLGKPPQDGFADPRHQDMGWRRYSSNPVEDNFDWTAQRIACLVPESGNELTADSYILEWGFETLNGVDFSKGCYVGQEIIARMKHKTKLRKGIARVAIKTPVSLHTPIMSRGKEAGYICSQASGDALAYLRFDRIGDNMTANGVPISLSGNLAS